MYWKRLDKIDSELYKGIAILMIVLHNFMHMFPTPKENEFNFDQERIFELLNIITTEPENILRALFSFFGHFGVQVFIFLSAYGLTKKYDSNKLNYRAFLWQRVLKIYPAFILAIIAWVFITGWFNYGLMGPVKVFYWSYTDLLLKLTLLSNFFPEKALMPLGPWWFIPFIFQFYFIFPFLLHLYSKWRGFALLILSIVSVLISLLFEGELSSVNIYVTVIGHLPEFCLGIYLAKKDQVDIRIPLLLPVIALVIYFAGNFYQIFWYVNHISSLIIILLIFTVLTPKVKRLNRVQTFFVFFGSISMPLFLVNGFLREPFIHWAMSINNWLITILLSLLSLVMSVVVALALIRSEKYVLAKITSKT